MRFLLLRVIIKNIKPYTHGKSQRSEIFVNKAAMLDIMDISKVSATLENGRIFSKGILVLLYIGDVSAFLVFPIGLLMAVTNFLENGIAQGILFLCCVLFFGGIFIGGFTFLVVRDKKLKKEVKIYLQDAVLLEAQTEDIGSLSVYRRFYDGTKIRVSFRYDGKVITKESGNPKKTGRINNGYDKVFWKYTNRKINVLYSPQYDQVMLLKD